MTMLAVMYLIPAKLFSPDCAAPNSVRLLSFVGLLSTISLILLGTFPSYYTLATLAVVPAVFVFVSLLFRPSLYVRSAKLRTYLAVSVALAAISWVTQFVWLLTR